MFTQTKEFKQLQEQVAARNSALAQARQRLAAHDAYVTSEFDAIKRNLSKVAARIKA